MHRFFHQMQYTMIDRRRNVCHIAHAIDDAQHTKHQNQYTHRFVEKHQTILTIHYPPEYQGRNHQHRQQTVVKNHRFRVFLLCIHVHFLNESSNSGDCSISSCQSLFIPDALIPPQYQYNSLESSPSNALFRLLESPNLG